MTRFRAPLRILADPLLQTTMTSLTSTPELMSALADGQLRDDELARAWQLLEQSDDAVVSWSHYHLIGDVLRTPIASASPLIASTDSASFVKRLNLKLHTEVFHGQSASSSALPSLVVTDLNTSEHAQPFSSHGAAANDGVFRWKLLAGFATLAAVSVIAWAAIEPAGLSPMSEQLVQSQDATQVLVASPQGVIVRDARLNELLAAHKQLGSMSALQAPSGFLQSAAFETSPGNGR